MFDFLPWMDEVHIVEMGRLILSGNDADTILTNANGTVFAPLYYIGPCLQELLFRAFGPLGPRLSPVFGLIATSFFFWNWLRKTNFKNRHVPSLDSFDETLLALTTLSAPLLIQSTRQVRVDTWVFACCFAILSLLNTANRDQSTWKFISAGALSALSLFIWPTAIVLFPLYVVCGFRLTEERRNVLRQIAIYCLGIIVFGGVLTIPILPRFIALFNAFDSYFGTTGRASFSMLNLFVPFVKETLRAPFLMCLATVGFGLWIHRRTYRRLFAFLFALGACILTSLHTFRFIYLTPFFLLMMVDTTIWLKSQCPHLTRYLLLIMVAYGFITGPLAYAVMPHERLPTDLESQLIEIVGTGSKRVFTPDYATYYLGRKLGWKQLAFGSQEAYSSQSVADKIINRADAAILQNVDPYSPLEESYTLYGFLRDYALNAARREKDSEAKSFPARIGATFAYPRRNNVAMGHLQPVATTGAFTLFIRK